MFSGSATFSPGASSLPIGIPLGSMPAGFVFASRYRIERLLGTGGMGAVYQARDQELELDVALKVIRPEITQTSAVEDFARRFKQELITARSVTHRNVVRIHDLGESGSVKYITMQFVKGTDLHSLLVHGPLPLPRVLSFAKQLAAGIAAAHEAGVVHRDLKPANILIDEADHLYISDFGLAKSFETTLAGMTRTGELLGTPRYISPEQVVGHGADHRSDLYAIGFILFEMATGASPFSGNSAIEQMFKRVQDSPADPKLVNPSLPEYFCRVITRCLQRQPETRYQSARELLDDLERQDAAPVATATPPRPSIVLTLPQARRSHWIAVAAVVIVLAVAAPMTWRYARARGIAAPSTSAAAVAQQHVAVVPFRIAGDQQLLGPVAAGIEEALSTKLFQLPSVNVAASSAVERAMRHDSLAAIGRELGANLLVSGTVQGGDRALRVTVTLDDTSRGTRIWAQDFSGVVGDLLTIEDQIYQRLVTAMKIEVTGEVLARAINHPTENIEAYQSYLRGRNAMRKQDAKNVLAAIESYESALKADARFARAYAGVSDAALRMYRLTKESSWLQRALSSAMQAQQLDDKLLEVHLALGSVYQATGKTTEAIAELTVASELAPNSDDVFRRLGRAYLSTGRGNEAIAAYEKSVALNPYYWASYQTLGFAHMQLGSYAKATEAFRKALELDPKNAGAHNDLGAAYMQLGRFNEAASSFRTALDLEPIAVTYMNLGIAYAYGGKHREAVPMFEKAMELSPNVEMVIGNLGDGYRWAGDTVKAAAAYDRAIQLALKDIQVNPRNAAARGNLAMYYAKKGEHDRASRMITSARAIDRSNVNLPYFEAVIDVLAGQVAAALRPLEEALAAGYSISAAQQDPDLQPLVSTPEFSQLVAKFQQKSL